MAFFGGSELGHGYSFCRDELINFIIHHDKKQEKDRESNDFRSLVKFGKRQPCGVLYGRDMTIITTERGKPYVERIPRAFPIHVAHMGAVKRG